MAALPCDCTACWRRSWRRWCVGAQHRRAGLRRRRHGRLAFHEYPPFFIFGALLSGFATVLLLIMPLRRLLRLERYITGRHLDVLGRLMLTSSLFVGYAYIMDAFTTYYGGEKAEIIDVSGEAVRRLRRHLLGHDPVQRSAAAAAVVPLPSG